MSIHSAMYAFVSLTLVTMLIPTTILEVIAQEQQTRSATGEPKPKSSNMQHSLYDDEPVQLQFKQAPVEDVLLSLVKLKGINLITSGEVVGTVTMELHNVPWHRALTLITQVNGLEFQLDEQVLLIAPQGQLANYALKQQALKVELQQIEPLVTQVFALKYANAKYLSQVILGAEQTIMSARGALIADERTNSLIATDTQVALHQLQAVIDELDTPAKQVLIEARMVMVRQNLDEQLGIQWGASATELPGKVSTSGSLTALNNDKNHYLDRLNVNLPAATPAGRVAVQVAKLADGLLLDLELSALERESKGEVIASPRILATHQQTSRIEQGTEIPYLQAAAHGATSVAFKKAVLSLEVTPQITPKGSVILDLLITQDARGDTVLTSTGPAVAIDTQQIATKVIAKDKQTIVLGGIYQQQLVESENRVPILADIPYLGRWFRSDASYQEKRQLLVFVTPKLLDSPLSE